MLILGVKLAGIWCLIAIFSISACLLPARAVMWSSYMWSVAALLLIAWCHWREFFRKRADADSDGKRRMLLKYLRVMIVIAVLFAFLDGADLWQVPNWLLLLTEMAIAVILLWKFFHNRKQ